MSDRPPDRHATASRQRRSTRFRAEVERLDARQLLAASLTGTPITISGNVGSPLRVQENILGTFGAVPYNPQLAPVGTPIPLVTLIDSDATSILVAANYTGTVNWGDGSAPAAALFGTYSLPSYQVVPPDALLVDGPEHTYATPGTYTITVSVAGPGTTGPLVTTTTATISAAPALAGSLSPSSDSGYLNSDNVTAINTPTYFGTTQPGATVTLTAANIDTGRSQVVGSGVADVVGTWSVTSTALPDGLYSFSATATSTFGGTTTVALAGGERSYLNNLRIDAAGPRITGFRITNARTGKFQVDFADEAGLFVPSLTLRAAYEVRRPAPTPRPGQTFPVATLTVSNAPVDSSYPLLAYPTATVTGTIGTGKPLISRNGTYLFTIHSSSILGVSGAPLDGEFTGKFPTGDGATGGDSQVRVVVRNGKAGKPLLINPGQAIAPGVRARGVAHPHGGIVRG